MAVEISGLNALLDLLARISGTVGRVWRAVRDPNVPASTMRIVPRDGYSHWHSDIDPEGEEYGSLNARLYVTNTTKNVRTRILGARFVPTGVFAKTIMGSIYVHPLPEDLGPFPQPEVRPGDTALFNASFSLYSKADKKERYKGRVLLIDQFGNEHSSPRLTFWRTTAPIN